jgi:hypothetical protein
MREKETIILTLDLGREVNDSNWENVQRLIDRVPQSGKIPVFRRTDCLAETLLHGAIYNSADPVIIEGLIMVMDMEEVNRGPDGDTLLHWCAQRHRVPLDVIAVVLANSPQIAFQQGGELGLTPMDMLLDPFTPYPRLDVARLPSSTLAQMPLIIFLKMEILSCISLSRSGQTSFMDTCRQDSTLPHVMPEITSP